MVRTFDPERKVKVSVTTLCDAELIKLANQNWLNRRECIEFGVQFKLAEKGLIDYPKCDLSDKLVRLTSLVQDQVQRIEELENGRETEESIRDDENNEC